MLASLAAALGFTTVALAVLLVLTFLRYGRRVLVVEAGARKVADGNLEARLPDLGGGRMGRLGRAFNEMTQRLRESREQVAYLQKASAWQEIAKRLAHEIKNPLTPINLAVQELQSQYKGGDERYQRLLEQSREIVAEEIGTLRRLVEEFSTFAKLPAAAPRRTDCNALIEDFLKQHKDEFSQVELSFEPARPSFDVFVDVQLMRRVIYNLIENATQALGERTDGCISLSAACNPKAGHAYFFVTDNGPGIRAELRNRVFDSYFTTKASGTGLGLAIVKKIVLEHRGTVALTDNPGAGAAFTITLPLADGKQDPDA
jgi:two-component system nitrogen regulation sensor histidine kinase NtrY